MSSTPASCVTLRSCCSHSLYPSVGPTLRLFVCSTRSDGGDELRWKHCSGLMSTAAISPARERIVARNDDDRTDFLRKRGFSKAETARIVETVLAEEGRPPESVFDFVQGISAVARSKPQQDARLELEGKAKKLLERAA